MNIKLLIFYVTRVSCQLVYDSELVFNSCFLTRVSTRVSNQFGNWYHFSGSYKLGSGSLLFVKLCLQTHLLFLCQGQTLAKLNTNRWAVYYLIIGTKFVFVIIDMRTPEWERSKNSTHQTQKSKSHVSAGWRGSLRTSFEEQQQFLATVLYWYELFIL